MLLMKSPPLASWWCCWWWRLFGSIEAVDRRLKALTTAPALRSRLWILMCLSRWSDLANLLEHTCGDIKISEMVDYLSLSLSFHLSLFFLLSLCIWLCSTWHLYGLIPLWLRRCLASSSDLELWFGHLVSKRLIDNKTNNWSAVTSDTEPKNNSKISRCTHCIKFSHLLNFQPQPFHEQVKGFSPVCLLMWAFRCEALA